MSIVDNLLQHLDKVKCTGPGTWSARCPAHEDRGPSLTIAEKDDGRILLHCFAGCDVHDVLAAVDLDISDLFPPRAIDLRVKPSADRFRLLTCCVPLALRRFSSRRLRWHCSTASPSANMTASG
jgi:hypothetical protein